MGISGEDTFVLEDGNVLEIDGGGARLADSIPSGRVFVDGQGPSATWATSCCATAGISPTEGSYSRSSPVKQHSGEIISGPDLISRGFVFEDDSQPYFERAKEAVLEALAALAPESRTVPAEVKEEMRKTLRALLQEDPRAPARDPAGGDGILTAAGARPHSGLAPTGPSMTILRRWVGVALAGKAARVAKGGVREKVERATGTLRREVEALFAIAGACYLGLSFLSYAPGRPAANVGGPVGHMLSELFVQAFGLASLRDPGEHRAGRGDRAARAARSRFRPCASAVLTAELLCSRRRSRWCGPGREASAGGWVGGFLASCWRVSSTARRVLIVLTGLVLTTMVVTGGSLVGGMTRDRRRATSTREALGGAFARWRERHRPERRRRRGRRCRGPRAARARAEGERERRAANGRAAAAAGAADPDERARAEAAKAPRARRRRRSSRRSSTSPPARQVRAAAAQLPRCARRLPACRSTRSR
jgi:hypothetical protein